MPIIGSTSLVRRQLGRRLRRLREAAHKTEQDVVESSIVGRTTLWRIETGKQAIKIGTVRALCWIYGADDETTNALSTLALATAGDGTGHIEDSRVPPWFSLFLDLERAASEIRTYDPELVPGILQTPEYTHALLRESGLGIAPDVVEQRVRLRRERQHTLLHRDPPIRLTAILGAGVLARPVGGPVVMAGQIHRLVELNRLDHIDIRVLPWRAGAHAAMEVGPFWILDFADPADPPVVYLEGLAGARYLENERDLAGHRRVFELIEQRATPIEEYRE
jgi:transcriptional regulator with XRE-family HTH domain